MLRARYSVLAFIPFFACAACGNKEAPTGNSTEQIGELVTAEPSYTAMVGTFEGATGAPGDLTRLVMKTDRSFHSDTVVACANSNVTSPCNPVAQDGVYKLYKLEDRTYVALYNKDGSQLQRYQYIKREKTLQLRRLAPEAPWRSLDQAVNAWCGAAADCALQNLPVGPCAGEWACGSSMCKYECAKPSCDSANNPMGSDCPEQPGETTAAKQ